MKSWTWAGLGVALILTRFVSAEEATAETVKQMAANEASAIGACKTFASAEDVFRRVDYNGNGILEYAQCLGGGVVKESAKADPAKIPPLEKGDEEQVKALLEKLASEEFVARENGSAALQKMGPRIVPVLETSLPGLNDAEARSRATNILTELKKSLQPAPKRNTEWGLYQDGKINLVNKAFADAEGPPSENPKPKEGYCFIVLTGQSASAPGGKRSYLTTNGCMTMGYALLAYPAEYGKTGRNSFQISGSGTIYQKDLGPNTAKLAEQWDAFDPNSSWIAAE